MTPTERVWKYVNKTDDCWLWTGGSSGGYGNYWDGDHTVKAHRFVYEMLVGLIPEGLALDHLCRVKNCVRPDHLEPVTHTENILRGDVWKINGLKTECKHGHPFDADNTYLRPDGGRACRECHRRNLRRWRAAKRSKGAVA